MKTYSPALSKFKRSLGSLLLLAVVPIAFGACAMAPSPTAIRDAATATQYAGAAAQIYSEVNASQEAAQDQNNDQSSEQNNDQSSDPAPESTTDAVLQGLTQGLQQANAILSQPR